MNTIRGGGINDLTRIQARKLENHNEMYYRWTTMLKRKNITVCQEWMKYSGFIKWEQSIDEEYKIGKVMHPSGTHYSPQTVHWIHNTISRALNSKCWYITYKRSFGVRRLVFGKTYYTSFKNEIDYKWQYNKQTKEILNDYLAKYSPLLHSSSLKYLESKIMNINEMSLAIWVMAMCLTLHGRHYNLHKALGRVNNSASNYLKKLSKKELYRIALAYE